MTLRLLPVGDRALLAEPDDAAAVLGLAAAARELLGVAEVVPAARTLLVTLDDPRSAARVTAALQQRASSDAPEPDPGGELVELDVRYDGADLAETAAEIGLDVDTLVERHSSGEYLVAFCGFAPGFAYLTGLEPALHVPRLAAPRTKVPAGSVAMAAEFTAVYPRPSPGGWRLLGSTDATLWDLDRTPPALLTPGARVRFRAT